MTENNIFNRLVKFFLHNRLITFIFLIAFVVMGLVTMPFNLKSGILPRDPVPVAIKTAFTVAFGQETGRY